jgi:hypothetical protein
MAGLPIILLRPGQLLRRLLISCFFKEKTMTQRELDEVYKVYMLFYGWEYPSQLLVIVICFTYACISPIIMPVGAVYFLLASLVYKKQVLVVYNPLYESGGKMFPSVCSRTLVGLICGQVTLAGYVLIRQGFTPVIILLPLPFFTFRMISVFNTMYANPSNGLTLEMSMELDKSAVSHSTEEVPSLSFLHFDKDVYRQPVLAEPKAEMLPYRRGMASGAASLPGYSKAYDAAGFVEDGSLEEEEQVGNDKGSGVGKFV